MDREKIIEIIKKVNPTLNKKYGVETIGIFGSFARGDYRKDSDLDIVVELEKPDMFSLIGVKQFLEEMMDMKVDVVRYRDNMNETLKKRIRRDTIYV